MAKRWLFPAHDPARIADLQRQAGISPVLAQLLVQRGLVQAEQVRGFLEAKLSDLRDPEQLPGVAQAADLIYGAVTERRRITVYGDYDADGMTATALLYRCLKLLSADVQYYVPNRMEEGYGLNAEAIEKLHARGTSMIVTVDCGIASVAEAQRARELGLQLVVTDHHHPGPELPAADAIVHPGLPGTGYPFAGLCGAGVAFKLAWALCQRASQSTRVSERLKSFLVAALGLAAMGTVADVVPLVDENRVLVRHGLKSVKSQPLPGLTALLRVTNLHEKSSLASEDIAFMLAPRLNAAGRLGQAQLGVELLATDDPERARALAEYIDQLNASRDSLERSVYLAAHKQLKDEFDPDEDPAFVLAQPGWHLGVIGIVAGRLAEKYHRPVVMISLDELGAKPGTGSARSIPGVDLHRAFAECSEHLVSHGGHSAAAGLRIDQRQVEAFRNHFCQVVSECCGAEMPVAELRIDAEASLSELTQQAVEQLEQLAPFGQGNTRPLLCASGVELADKPVCMGRSHNHLAVRVRQGGVVLRGMAFNKAEWLPELEAVSGPLDLAYRPVINEFRGRRSVEMHVVDWRPHQ
ncbi:MAG: single-stranded-DNA-specific exonuclease RecJ [Pirellulales bacterium]